MPRRPNFPTTTDETQRLELAFLLRSGLLQPDCSRSTTLTWSSRGEVTGRIGLEAHNHENGRYLRLHYTVNGATSYDYRVELESVASNLPGNGGQRLYMVCPVSGRRATVLYLRAGTGTFAHRLAYGPERLYYDSQLEPKRLRGMGKYFAVDREWEKEYRKGRKTHYRGRPTRWYARLLGLEAQADAVAPQLLQLLQHY